MGTISMTKKYNLIYRLRKKGYIVKTRQRTIEMESGADYMKICQVRRLVGEFNFAVQFIIPEKP
jgi:hypothetical protein